MQEIKTDTKSANQRLDKFLMKYLNKAPKSFVYKMLRKKNIKLNGKKAEGNEMLTEGDTVTLYLSDDTIAAFRAEIRLKTPMCAPEIVYEDENIIAANKPAGLLVQGSGAEDADDLNTMLLYYLRQKNELTDTYKPGIANRLDRNTGGLVLMGKNLPAAQALAEAFREKYIEKLYITAVKGRIDTSGEISGYHTKNDRNKVLITAEKREGSVPVKTLYTPLYTGHGYTVLSVKLVTGKSHQIRESFKSIGNPVIGDPKYGDAEINRFFKQRFGLDHQLLYAVSLCLKTKNGILKYLNNKKIVCGPDKTAQDVLEYIKSEAKL